MTDRELLQNALDALESLQAWPETPENFKRFRAIEALRARLAQPEPAECDGGQCGIGGYCKECPKTQPEPEPVAWRFNDRNMWCYVDHLTDLPQDKFKPLYTAPPQREWQVLTDKEYETMAEHYVTNCYFDTLKYAQAIETKLKEKN